MFSRNIPLNTLDYTGKRSDNLVINEYYRLLDASGIEGYENFNFTVFVPRTGPFYTDSLQLTKPTGEVLVEGEHYEFFGIATALTAFIKDKEVGMFIRMLDETITEWFASYQVVGHFGILNQDLVRIINTSVDDERPIYYENLRNKPKWFYPEVHKHDLRWGIHSFQDLADGIKSIAEIKSKVTARETVAIEQFYSVIMSHIDAYESMLLEYIKKHDNENVAPYGNSHGLTAAQVSLEKVDNYPTANLLNIIDGFRKDRHVTVDVVKEAIDVIGVNSESLIEYGTLPILRYGSESFIPPQIQGSFEGMGGNDFHMGFNVEPDGSALILMNRNDGRVNGLYFMQNTDNELAPSKWFFTGYKYTHSIEQTDNVKLRYVIPGSNGKFILLEGLTSDGKSAFYYSLGSGTFNPLKHKLTKIPDGAMRDDFNDSAFKYVITGAHPKRIILAFGYSQSYCVSNEEGRRVGFDLPTDGTTFSGVSFSSSFAGYKFWEYDIASQTWRLITLTYTQPGQTESVTSTFYIPFKTVVSEITADNPRADGNTNYKYGLSAFEYEFTKPITYWYLRLYFPSLLERYDSNADILYIKYIYSPYGGDGRSTLLSISGHSSLGFALKNRKINSGVVSYDVENGRSLTSLASYDTAPTGGKLTDNSHLELTLNDYDGENTLSWLTNTRLLVVSSTGYGNYPLTISDWEFKNSQLLDRYSDWITERLDGYSNAVLTRSSYNETNLINLSIGAHSTFWTQLDPNDNNTFGAIFASQITNSNTKGLWFRKYNALDSEGYPTEPSETYDLFDALDGVGLKTKGYPLDNTVVPVTNEVRTHFITPIFIKGTNNNKTQYSKNLVAHTAFPVWETRVTNTTAVTQASLEWEVVKNAASYTFSPTKTYEMSTAINDVLVPYMEKAIATKYPTIPLITNNALATHHITPVNLQSSTTTNMYIFSFMGFDKASSSSDVDNKRGGVVLVAFTLSGGTANSSGIITDPVVTPVGEVMLVRSTYSIRSDVYPAIIQAGYSFFRNAIGGGIYSRDIVQQLENGASRVYINHATAITVIGNIEIPCTDLLVTEAGITEAVLRNQYWTTSAVTIFHHPYYGMLNHESISGKPARKPVAASEVGWPYPKNITTLANYTPTYDNWVLGNSNYVGNGFTLYFSTDQKVLLNGRGYVAKATSVDLKDIASDPSNKTFYVYLDYDNAEPTYTVTLTAATETPSRALIAIVTTDANAISGIEGYNVFTMNGIRISTVKRGASIPSASGSIESKGQLAEWVTKNRK